MTGKLLEGMDGKLVDAETDPCCCEEVAPCECPCGSWPPEAWPCGGLVEEYSISDISVAVEEYASSLFDPPSVCGTGSALRSGTLTADIPIIVEMVSDQSCQWFGRGDGELAFGSGSPITGNQWTVWLHPGCYWRVQFDASGLLVEFRKYTGITPIGRYEVRPCSKNIFTAYRLSGWLEIS